MSDDGVARERRRARRIRWLVRAGGPLFRALASTWRVHEVNREPSQRLRDAGHPVIFTLWHGEMLPLLWHHRREGITVLISEHGDGEIVSRVAESLGFGAVRGSTSQSASRALLGMSRVVQSGSDLGFTPDGPRGPARTFAPGALVVAQRTHAPVVTLAAVASRAWHLRSWDRFMIPRPFARVTIAYGDPMTIDCATPREAAEQGPRFEALMAETARRATDG